MTDNENFSKKKGEIEEGNFSNNAKTLLKRSEDGFSTITKLKEFPASVFHTFRTKVQKNYFNCCSMLEFRPSS